MRPRPDHPLAWISIALTLAAGVASSSQTESGFLKALRNARSEVRWQPASEIAGDFDGDLMADTAALGYVPDGVVLVIKATTTNQLHFVDFRVAKDDPDAFCSVPVRLWREPLSCAANAGDMPGCKEAPRASSLALGDGVCKPLNVYWDHERHVPAWWR